MRVLNVSSTLARGGIASSQWHLQPELLHHAIEPANLCLYTGGYYAEQIAAFGIPTESLGFRTKYALRGFGQLAAYIRRNGFDIVNAHGWPAVLYTSLASVYARGPRYVLTEHNISNRRRRWKLKPLEYFLYSRYRHVIAVSRAAATGLAQWLPNTAARTSVIYNGIAFDRLHTESPGKARSQQSDSFQILNPGGLEQHKGIDVLLNALATLNSSYTVCIAGDGSQHAGLQARAVQLGIATRVNFIGFRSDLPALMQAADVFAIASRREGCPMSLLEAMAVGAPIVATNVGGNPELVRDKECGLIVPVDDAGALAAAIRELCNDRALAQRFGRVARERCETHFTAQQQAAAVAAVYSSL